MTDRGAGYYIVSFQGAQEILCNINPPHIGPLVTISVIVRAMCISSRISICLARNRAVVLAVAGSTSAFRRTDWFFHGGREEGGIHVSFNALFVMHASPRRQTDTSLLKKKKDRRVCVGCLRFAKEKKKARIMI